MALQPVGPLPASTYWRRRAALLTVVLLGLLLATRACSAGGASPRRTALVASPTPTATVPGAPGDGPVAPASADPLSAGAGPSLPPSALPASSPAAPPPCADSALAIKASTDAASYRAGAAPRVTLVVRNTGTSCRRALGPGAVELQVLSGRDRIWSSDDCATSHDQGVMTLPAGATRATTVQWSGRRSQPGCHAGPTAQPGTYRVTVRVGTVLQQVAVFDITA